MDFRHKIFHKFLGAQNSLNSMSLTPFEGDCHSCAHFGTCRQIRQHDVILVARSPLCTFLLGQRAINAHTARAVVLPVQVLVGAAPSARREGTLVTEAEFSMFGTLSAAVATHLAICEALGKLVFKMSSGERAGDVFWHMYGGHGRWYGGILGGTIMLRWLVS